MSERIPFPEDLPDELWIEKFRQIEWLADVGILGVKNATEQ